MFYGAGGPSGDINKFVEMSIAQLLKDSPTDPETVVTINEISGALIPAPVCSVLAVVLYEVLDNCAQHAFDSESPVNFIRLKLEESRDPITADHIYELSVGDSGAGIPTDLFKSPQQGTGAAIILALLAEFDGKAKVLDEPDNSVVVTIVDDRIEPYV